MRPAEPLGNVHGKMPEYVQACEPGRFELSAVLGNDNDEMIRSGRAFGGDLPGGLGN